MLEEINNLKKELAEAKAEMERLGSKSDLAWNLHNLKQEQLVAAQQQVKKMREKW